MRDFLGVCSVFVHVSIMLFLCLVIRNLALVQSLFMPHAGQGLLVLVVTSPL